MIELEKFSLSFKQKKVLKEISMRIEKGEHAAIIGNNASGKTSLALFIAKVIPEFIKAETSGKWKIPEKVSLVMQNPSNQFFAMTVKEELGEKGIAIAKKLGAGHLLEKNVFELSEGEKQKINLIANLSLKHDVLLLDEPLELLDPFEAKRFRNIIEKTQVETIVWLEKENSFFSRGEKPGKKSLLLAQKNSPFVRMKKIFLGKQEKVFLPKKKKSALGKTILEADFQIEKNSFRLRVDFSLREGEKIAVIGKNGSGKTSFLKAIAGLEKISGKISALKKTSFVPQNPSHLFFEETVEEELVDKGNAHKLGIEALLKSAPDKLSRGQQKLVSIATAEEKTIVLLDEPTTWLDAGNKKKVYEFVNKSREAMVIATHDKKMLDYCDKVFIIEKGVLKECSNTTTNRFFLALQNH